MKEAEIRAEIYRILYKDEGYWPITQTDAVKCWQCGALVKPKIGRPDIMVMNPSGPAIVVEVKAFPPPAKGKEWAQTSISFDRIEDKQRKWLTRWDNAVVRVEPWAARAERLCRDVENPVVARFYKSLELFLSQLPYLPDSVTDLIADTIPAQGSFIGLGTRHGRGNSTSAPRMLWVIPWQAWLNVERRVTEFQNTLPLAVRKGLNKQIQAQKLDAMHLFAPYALKWSHRKGGFVVPPGHPLYVRKPE
jgi:hypothetical protein